MLILIAVDVAVEAAAVLEAVDMVIPPMSDIDIVMELVMMEPTVQRWYQRGRR